MFATFQKQMQGYLDKKFTALQKQQYDSKKSILHDVNKNQEETLRAISQVQGPSKRSRPQITLPISTHEAFLEYEKMLEENLEVKQNLVIFVFYLLNCTNKINFFFKLK